MRKVDTHIKVCKKCGYSVILETDLAVIIKDLSCPICAKKKWEYSSNVKKVTRRTK